MPLCPNYCLLLGTLRLSIRYLMVTRKCLILLSFVKDTLLFSSIESNMCHCGVRSNVDVVNVIETICPLLEDVILGKWGIGGSSSVMQQASKLL